MQYRRLKKGEIIQKGDQCDGCANPWKDEMIWVDVVGNIGEPAPDPAFPSHRQYRRPISPSTYDGMLEALRISEFDRVVAGAVRDRFRNDTNVEHVYAAAVITYLLEVVEQLQDSNYGLRSALDATKRDSAT